MTASPTAGVFDEDTLRITQGKAVGVKDLREFLGVMTAHKVARGTYATTSTYTPDARKFAKDSPTCASCGIKMVERTPSKGGSAFWGCSNYPRCKTTLQMASP